MKLSSSITAFLNSHRNQSTLTLFLFALGMAAFFIRLYAGPMTVDDAYITFRYARNLLDGHGFVYNLGECVLGTTTPLWTLALTVLAWVTRIRDLPWLALFLAAALDAVGAILLARLGKRLLASTVTGYAAGLIYAFSAESRLYASGGMEVSFFCALAVAALHERLSGRRISYGILLACLPLVRPEGIFITVPALLFEFILSGKKRAPFPWIETVLVLAIGCAWGAFAFFYFGSPIPHSIQAKTHAYAALHGYLRSIQGLKTSMIHWVSFGLGDSFARPGVWKYAFPFVAAVYFYGGWRIGRRDIITFPFLAFPCALILFFGITNPLMFGWYAVPAVPFLALGFCAGAEEILRLILGRIQSKYLRVALVITVIVLAVSLQIFRYQGALNNANGAPPYFWIGLEREAHYREIALSLNDLPGVRGGTVAAEEIGALGYYFEGSILDAVGLVSPEAVRYNPPPFDELAGNHAIPSRMIFDLRPEAVVGMDVYLRNSLLNKKAFFDQYQLRQSVPFELWGSSAIRVYVRHDILATPGGTHSPR